MNRTSTRVALGLALMLPAAALAGPNKKVKGFTADGIVKILGDRVVVTDNTTDEYGDPLLLLQSTSGNEYKYRILFYDCEESVCSGIQFRGYWTLGDNPGTHAQANQWNYTKRDSAAYVDNDGDLVVERFQPLFTGVTEGYMDALFDDWHEVLDDFGGWIDTL